MTLFLHDGRVVIRRSSVEKDAFLLRLAMDEPRLALSLRQRLGLLRSPSSADGASCRAVGELLAAAGFAAEDC